MSQLYQILHYHNFSDLLNMENTKLDAPHILKNKNSNLMINKNFRKWLNISKETFKDTYHFISKCTAIMHKYDSLKLSNTRDEYCLKSSTAWALPQLKSGFP